jgi:DNA (cytosine-5)-methyltransferase 1
MANTNRNGFNKSFRNARSMDGTEQEKQTKESKSWGDAKVSTVCCSLANPSSIRSQGQREHEQSIGSKESSDWQTNLIKSIGSSDFWKIEPNVGRVVDGLADRVDRLKAIGNGQVPLCAAIAWRILTER